MANEPRQGPLSKSKVNEFKEAAVQVIKYGTFEQMHAADSFRKSLSKDRIDVSLMYDFGCPFFWRQGYARICDKDESDVDPHRCKECTDCWKMALSDEEIKSFDCTDERLKQLCFSVDEFFKILDSLGYQDGDTFWTLRKKIEDIKH